MRWSDCPAFLHFDARMNDMSSSERVRKRSTSWRTLREWINEPHDYEWISHLRSSRAIAPIFRVLLGVMTVTLGSSAFFKLIGPDTPTTAVGKLLSASMVIGSLIVMTCWFTLPFPGRRGLLAFGIFADLGIASAIVLVPDRDSGLFGCIIFAISGTFATLFVSARWLIAHVIFATSITTLILVLAFQQGTVDPTTIAARATVLFGAVTVVPIFSHLTWRTLYRDARDSDRDHLTGLFNRRGLEAAVIDLFDSARAQEKCLAFVVVDIDKFKMVNDLHGHSEGDRVIIRTADRLKTHVGNQGVVGRVGGEEYLAVISGTSERISELIDGITSAISDHSDLLPTTVSVGAVIMSAESKAWTGGSSAISVASNVADSMMYQAKAAGGNGLRSTEI